MAHDVFVSYASEDKTTADALVATLEQQGVRCWIAPRDIPPGKEYAEVIVGAIGEARVLVLVFSAFANTSPHVMREVERAVSKGVAIVPFRIEDVVPSRSIEYFIGGTHWLDALTPPLQQHLDRLILTIQTIIGQEPVARARATGGSGGRFKPPGSAPWWRRGPILPIAGGLLAVAAVLALFFLLFSGGSGGDDDDNVGVIESPTPTRSASGDDETPTGDAGAGTTPTATGATVSGDLVDIDPGISHICAVSSAGTAKCWGENRYGQLGNGSTVISETPVYVCSVGAGPPCSPSQRNVLSDIKAIGAGDAHSCALTNEGGVTCWGANGHGQLGNGTLINTTTPVDVEGLGEGVAAISVGESYTCALMEAGGLKCWGYNRNGQLGQGTTTDLSVPTDVPGLTSGVASFAIVDESTGAHTCAIMTGGALKCWGSGGNSQLGNGSNQQRSAPIDVPGLSSGVSSVAVGGAHTCAVIEDGAQCWGISNYGQIGNGTTSTITGPGAIVQGLASGVKGIAVGYRHSCAVTDDGKVKCWGDNSYGQLGVGEDTRSTPSPIEVPGLSGIETIIAGSNRTCAITTEGGAFCWGARQPTPLEVLGAD